MSKHQGWLDDPYHGQPTAGDPGDVFIQWKNTDVCFDFHCPDCNAHGHFDGYFAYGIRCGKCGAEFEMPCKLYPRRVKAQTDVFVTPEVDE